MNFMRWIPLYLTISLIFIGVGLFSIFKFGFTLSIGFTGGTLIEIATNQTQPDDNEKIKEKLNEIFAVESIQKTESGSILIRGDEINEETFELVKSSLNELYTDVELLRFEAIGPVVSKELIQKTISAILLVAVIIMVYIGWQFNELRYGVAAIVAMIHDLLILLGLYSLFGYFLSLELDVLFVTAMLTTLSFSVHDTIVVFHRVRELRHKYPRTPLTDILNAALTETMTRSVNNSVTIVIMLLSLVVLGGQPLRGFAIALLIGAITGTYSSPFVSVPFLLGWEKIELWWKNKKN